MLLVTGAIGELGRQIVEGLPKQTSGVRIGVGVRDPEKAAAIERRPETRYQWRTLWLNH